jgi:hypothetical protein
MGEKNLLLFRAIMHKTGLPEIYNHPITVGSVTTVKIYD